MSALNIEKKYIFIGISRTACGSMGELVGGGGHTTIEYWQGVCERKGLKWKKIWKFAFVRNPYDRFVSAYHHLGYHKISNINDYLINYGDLHEAVIVQPALFRPQHEFLTIDGELAMNFIGRFENLEKGWKKVARKLKIKEPLPHNNDDSQTDMEELTEESKVVLYEFYKKDFELFGYDQ